MAGPSEKSSVKNFTVDGEFLTKLLECPVCLGQLKSSSKVLPCQHTFCERCLYEISVAQNRLVCPECRAPVNVPLHKLPRNIMLVRFLEGVKNKKVKHAEEDYSRTARLQGLKKEFFPTAPTAIEVVFQKMKEDPQFKNYVEYLKKRASKEPAPPNILKIRFPEPEEQEPSQPNTSGQIPEQPSPPSDSARNAPPSDKDAIAVQNLRRLCETLKASPSNLSAKKSTEPKNKSYESRFHKRNKHILTKIVRALNYPNTCSYTGPRKSSGST